MTPWTVALVGAESTGKTTLASMLAHAFRTVFVPEFGRSYGEPKDRRQETWETHEFIYIAKAQLATEAVAASMGYPLIFCDTDVLTTALFHELYLDRGAPDSLRDLQKGYDLTFLCWDDFPFTDDGVRHPETRHAFQRALVREMTAAGRGFYILRGPMEARLEQAIHTIGAMFGLEAVA